MPLPESFPAGTKFAEWDDIPLSREPDAVVALAWDKSEPRPLSHRWLHSYALSEADFRARVAALHGSE